MEDLERVWRARELDVEHLLLRLRAQPVDERPCLPVRHEVVAGALHHEERDQPRTHERDRRPVPVAGGVDGRARAEHPRRRALGHPTRPPAAIVEDREEIGRWVERDAREDGRVGRLEAGLVLGVVHGERRHRREVSSRGAAAHHDAGGVAAVLGDVVADPRDRAFHVDDRGRHLVVRREAIVDRDAHPPGRTHPVHEGPTLLTFVADEPRATVDLQQHRSVLDAVARQVDVGEVTSSGVVRVANVGDAADATVAEVEGDQQPQRSAAERIGCAESGGVERTRDGRPAAPSEPQLDAEEHEAGHGRDEPDPPDDIVETAEDGEDRHHGSEDEDRPVRELGCQPLGEEADRHPDEGA